MLMIWELRTGVQVSEFRVWGFEFEVLGLGFKI